MREPTANEIPVGVAGVGVICSVGCGVDTLHVALQKNASGLRPSEKFNSPRFQSNIVGAIPADWRDTRLGNGNFAENPAWHFACEALQQAFDSAQKTLESIPGKRIGLVISDMAPNISGIDSADQARAMHLAELALDFSVRHLQPNGTFLVKLFQGVGFEDYIKLMRSHFTRVVTRKPKASRDRSSEQYLLGLGKLEKLE